MVFMEGDYIGIKVSLMKDVMRFGKKEILTLYSLALLRFLVDLRGGI